MSAAFIRRTLGLGRGDRPADNTTNRLLRRRKLRCRVIAIRSSSRMRRSMMISVVLLGGLTLGGAALAADPTPGTNQVMYNGLKVGIDARTGKLRPLTAAESRKLDMGMTGGRNLKLVNRKQALASKKNLPGGGVAMKLPADQMTSLTATQNSDGTLTLSEGGGKAPELSNE
ncbi:MAG: hypothetical protein ABI831_25960 [Betaproteobacteria bacterium]